MPPPLGGWAVGSGGGQEGGSSELLPESRPNPKSAPMGQAPPLHEERQPGSSILKRYQEGTLKDKRRKTRKKSLIIFQGGEEAQATPSRSPSPTAPLTPYRTKVQLTARSAGLN